MSTPLRILGLDLASVNSGMCLIEALPAEGHPAISVEVLHHSPIEVPSDFHDMLTLAGALGEIAYDQKCDLVVIEGYVPAMGAFNTTAIQQAEFISQVKSYLIAYGMNVLIVPPTTMRSFVKIPPNLKDKGKKHIIGVAEAHYGFKAEYSLAKKRSDVTDAFTHAVIGAHAAFAKLGTLLTEGLLRHEKRVIYGDENQNKIKPMIGLIHRGKDAWLHYDGSYDDNGSSEKED